MGCDMLNALFKESNHIEQQIHRLELKHLRKKTIFISVILVALITPTMLVLYAAEAPLIDVFVYFILFIFVLAINSIFIFYRYLLPNIYLSMYITTIGLYLVAFGLILDIQSPSILTVLFLVYAIVSLYQEVKVSIMNNIILLFSGTVFLSVSPIVLENENSFTPSAFFMLFILVIFVALLSVTSFILIKRKHYIYRQVVDVKEEEYKYNETILDMQATYRKKTFNEKDYYKKIEQFTDRVSETIGISNVFKERLKIINDIPKLSDKDILKQYPETKKNDLEEIKQLELSQYKKIIYVAFKSAQLPDMDTEYTDFLFEQANESLNHRTDDYLVKVVATTTLYLLLRIDKPFAKKLDHAQIMTIFSDKNFYHLLDANIYHIFKEHEDYFKNIDLSKLDNEVIK